ncbi:MAG: glycosyltransferase [Bacteroidetes bacterium]|nr:glycosyltransferase [Bacteroidota bacterium]
MADKLSILFICNKSPWPPKEGGPIAMNNIIEGVINKGHKAKVLAINTNKYNFDPSTIPTDYKNKTEIELVYVDLGIKPTDAFFNLFSRKSYHVQRFISKPFEKKLVEVLHQENYDIVQIETLFMSPYIDIIRNNSNAKIILRAHNIEHLIWKRVARSTNNPFKKNYLKHLANTLENYERKIISKYDGIAAISEKDKLFFEEQSDTPVAAISFGVDMDKYVPSNQNIEEHSLFHIGSMNWIPNNEGMKWFLDNVWEDVCNIIPDIRLYLAGREMPKWLFKKESKNLRIEGEVPDALKFIQSKSISIVPLLSGSGIRIKIIESMAMGKVVISTSIGAEGINYINGENIIIADSSTETKDAIIKLYNDKELTTRIGNNARKLIATNHNNEIIIIKLIEFYKSLIQNRTR